MKKTLFLPVCAATLCALWTGCTSDKRYVDSDGVMLGTTFHVCAELENISPQRLYARIMRIDTVMKASMSIFDEQSLLSRINRGETDVVDEHIAYNLTLARAIGEHCDGRYDITVKPLTDAWGFAARTASADPNIDSLLQFVGSDKWCMERGGDGTEKVVRSDPRVQFDLNSIAKGYTVDKVAEMLEREGAENYLVEIGGEVRCRGVNEAGNTWTVGIDAPYEGNMSPGLDLFGAVRLRDRALATSGNYRRFRVDDMGRKIVHTIDPRTGRGSVSRLLSATVEASTCAEADALATMFMAVGADDAVPLAESMRDSIGVFFILDDGRDGYEFFKTIEE